MDAMVARCVLHTVDEVYVRSLMWPTAHEYFDRPQGVDRADYSKLWGLS